LGGRFPCGDGTALQKKKLPILNRPFDVAPRPVDPFTLESEFAQGHELGVVETQLGHLRRRELFLESAAVGEGADRHSLSPSLSLQHLAGAIDAEVVRDDKTGDYRFAQAPTGLDQAFIGARDRVLGEHDSGGGGVQKRLDDNANAWLRKLA